MLLHICCQLNLSGKLQPFCLHHAKGVCMNSKYGAFWKCQTCYTSADQLNGLSLVTLMLTRQLRLDAHSTWKCSLALLRQEICDNKQAQGKLGQSCTGAGRRNKNLTLGSVVSKRTARASEERIDVTEFCLWTKVWIVIKPGYSWLQKGILSPRHTGEIWFVEHEGFVLAAWMHEQRKV